MSKIRKTEVRFYEAACVDELDRPVDIESDFWTELVDMVVGLSEDERTVVRNGRELIGFAGIHTGTKKPYLYIGKTRHKSDYPDDLARDAIGPTSLAHNKSIFRMSEWTYVVPTEFGPSVAVVKSSGGAMPEDIAHWVATVARLNEIDHGFKLMAILSDEQMATMEQADLFGSLDVVLSGSQAIRAGKALGAIGTAAAEAAELAGPTATIQLRWSYGHEVPDTTLGHQFAENAKSFIRGKKYTKAKASLKTALPDGRWKTDTVNFVTEMITHKITLSDSVNEAIALDKLIPQIVRAIMENRKYLLD